MVPRVGIIMGSRSDWPTMRLSAETLATFDVAFETAIISAHRTPERMFKYASSAEARGLHILIAGTAYAAHLPGMVASLTALPVIGVPVESRSLKGLDSLLSIVQMPSGAPVATMAIGPAGATNAALMAIRILALADPELRRRLAQARTDLTDNVPETVE